MNRCDRFRTKNGASPLREIGNPLIVDLCSRGSYHRSSVPHPEASRNSSSHHNIPYDRWCPGSFPSRHMADEKGRIQVSLYPVSVYDALSVTKPFLSVLTR